MVGVVCLGYYPTVKPNVAVCVRHVVGKDVVAVLHFAVLGNVVFVHVALSALAVGTPMVVPTFFHGVHCVTAPSKVDNGVALQQVVLAEVHFVAEQLRLLLGKRLLAVLDCVVVHAVDEFLTVHLGVGFAVGCGQSVQTSAFHKVKQRCGVAVTDTVLH